jgi:hypothetical protein
LFKKEQSLLRLRWGEKPSSKSKIAFRIFCGKEITKDMYLYSPNGTKYKITVDDNGILSAEIIF